MSVNNMKRPLILKRMMLMAPGNTNKNPDLRNTNSNMMNSNLIKLSTIPLYREDVIFESKGEKFLPGEYRSITILNKLNNITNNCTTIAKCITRDNKIIEKTSDNLIRLIGQDGYNTVFYALCSVINQEYRIKAILSILTAPKVEPFEEVPKEKAPIVPFIVTVGGNKYMRTNNKSCQTDETRLDTKKKRIRKRIRKVLVPHVIKPPEIQPKRITVDPFTNGHLPGKLKCMEKQGVPADLKLTVKTESIEEEISSTDSDREKFSLPDLGHLHDLDSNDSVKSYSTLHTFKTITDLLVNPISLVKSVDKHTKPEQIVLPNHSIMLMDRSVVQVPFKPEDDFHIASKENLLYLNEVDRKKLLLHQMQIDYKHCLRSMDEDGNLPIHLAVINDDLELLKRQCVILKIRKQSLDIPAKNNLTALKLSIFRECPSSTSVLLERGADPLLTDAEHSTCAHLAAELRTEHLPVILNHCKINARSIIQNAEELQTPEWQSKTDEELADSVIQHLCALFDKQGYSPLMLASKLGHYENVRLLLENAPRTVHLTMPTSGNTALFLAVAAACSVAAERGNKSKVVDHFRKTIEILLENGADPSIDNHSGTNVNLLLQEFNCAELSMLVANKVTYIKYFNGEQLYTKNFDKYLLMKEGNTVSIKDINWTPKTLNSKTVIKTEDIDEINDVDKEVLGNHARKEMQKDVTNVVDDKIHPEKPVITENILIKTPLQMQKPNPKAIVASPVNLKEFVIKPTVKMTTFPTIKKVIWQIPAKRKVQDDNDNTKRCKNT